VPVDVSILGTGTGVLITGHGVLTSGDLTEAFAGLASATGRIQRCRYFLFDTEAVTSVKLSVADLQAIAAQNHELARSLPPGLTIAVVTPQDAAHGLALMWEGFVQTTRCQTMVFRSRTTAEKWLQSKVASPPNSAAHFL